MVSKFISCSISYLIAANWTIMSTKTWFIIKLWLINSAESPVRLVPSWEYIHVGMDINFALFSLIDFIITLFFFFSCSADLFFLPCLTLVEFVCVCTHVCFKAIAAACSVMQVDPTLSGKLPPSYKSTNTLFCTDWGDLVVCSNLLMKSTTYHRTLPLWRTATHYDKSGWMMAWKKCCYICMFFSVKPYAYHPLWSICSSLASRIVWETFKVILYSMEWQYVFFVCKILCLLRHTATWYTLYYSGWTMKNER